MNSKVSMLLAILCQPAMFRQSSQAVLCKSEYFSPDILCNWEQATTGTVKGTCTGKFSLPTVVLQTEALMVVHLMLCPCRVGDIPGNDVTVSESSEITMLQNGLHSTSVNMNCTAYIA